MHADLNPMIWPQSATRNSAGEIVIGGLPITVIARDFSTPVFIFDEDDIRTRARQYVSAFNSEDISTKVYYASKAFQATTVTKWLTQEGLGMDVSTMGELEVALRGGAKPEDIIFHGNNKSIAELERAVAVGVGRIVIDSLIEIERLNAIAARAGIVQQVYIRLTVGVEAHTHDFMATAHEDQKFGMSIANGAAMAAVDAIMAADALSLAGLHSHIGSQIFDAAGFEVATHRVIEFASAIYERHSMHVSELDVGGGMGIAYVEGDDPLDVTDMAKAILDIVRTECHRVHMPLPHLAVEPGRAIIGAAGITVYEVGTIKPVDLDHGQRHYISVDGGMSDNIRTALYDADYTVTIANRVSIGVDAQSRIVGKHCESGDIVVRDAQLPADIRPGDLLAVAATGAYCRSMASNYNMIGRPAVVGVKDAKATVILRGETIDDLLSLDPGAK